MSIRAVPILFKNRFRNWEDTSEIFVWK